jgi:hypothetical protein
MSSPRRRGPIASDLSILAQYRGNFLDNHYIGGYGPRLRGDDIVFSIASLRSQ